MNGWMNHLPRCLGPADIVANMLLEFIKFHQIERKVLFSIDFSTQVGWNSLADDTMTFTMWIIWHDWMTDDLFRKRNRKVCGNTDKSEQNKVQCEAVI